MTLSSDTTKRQFSVQSGELACRTGVENASKLSRPGFWCGEKAARVVGHLRSDCDSRSQLFHLSRSTTGPVYHERSVVSKFPKAGQSSGASRAAICVFDSGML